MNMVGMNMVEVDDMDMMEEHFHLMNHRPEVDGMDTVEEHFHPMNHRPEVEGIDTVLVRHWTGDGAVRYR
jgi:hypothetical protein